MVLSQKFLNVVSPATVSVSSLYIDHSYPVSHPEHVETKFGPTIRLEISEQDDNIFRVFLPRRYSEVFTDEGVATINEQTVLYHLVYKGKRPSSKAQILLIEQ
jgi:hypothetical protein